MQALINQHNAGEQQQILSYDDIGKIIDCMVDGVSDMMTNGELSEVIRAYSSVTEKLVKLQQNLDTRQSRQEGQNGHV
jgi:hypothetical protein